MSGIVLSASVRQNLLSLQSTAALLATTQNDLATGNKVNTALDNPTEFFTAQGLNNRASDISNLLDSIGNGVQVLQAANTGITSLQNLIANAQSIANQVLQTPVGYSTKSNVSSIAITGANANNLLGSVGAPTNASSSAVTPLSTITSTDNTPATAGTVTGGTFTTINVSGAGTPTNAVDTSTVNLGTTPITDPGAGNNVSFTVNGQTVTIAGGSGNISLSQVESAINLQAGTSAHVTASDDGAGHLVLTSTATPGTADTITVAGTNAAEVVGTATTAHGTAGTPASDTFTVTVNGTGHNVTLSAATVAAYNSANSTSLNAASLSATDVATLINSQVGSPVATITGGALTFTSTTTGPASTIAVTNVTPAGTASGTTGITAANNTGAAAITGTSLTFQINGQTVSLAAGPSYTGAQVAAEINAQVSGVNASYATGKLVISSTGTPGASDAVTINNFSGGNNASVLGYAAVNSVTANGTDATGGLAGQTLVIAATGGGTATNVTFGTGTGEISTLNQLNAALAQNNLQATISTTGVINIVTSDDSASATIGTITGTATGTGSAFANAVAQPPVLDPNSQATRANLVAQYNNVLNQINTTSQDSSFNGINLLNGDTLNLTFDETGASKLSITGVTFNDAGLGLSTLSAGTDFLDSDSANTVLAQLTAADTTLRGEASALGSNLSIVEIRQDFNKNLINVLQTGASNLTLADPNEEAANSQALSTRQSIAVSALALANQSQQSVLQLLR